MENRSVQDRVDEYMSKVTLIVMDGCSMPIDFVETGFKGLILVAASPSLYVKNLQDAIMNHFSFTMPPTREDEAFTMAKLLDIDKEVVRENLRHMNGISRYLFKRDAAKQKVKEAIHSVTASAISRMVSMQSTSKLDEQVAVHSLVLWKVTNQKYEETPTFGLVSQYAEHLVAKKLAKETAHTLRTTRQELRPLSGAEGYAGALFEAYAIRILQGSGKFTLRSLEGSATKTVDLVLKTMETEPIEIECNKLMTAGLDHDKLSVDDGNPRLLWPTTTNFPTFDCCYFH